MSCLDGKTVDLSENIQDSACCFICIVFAIIYCKSFCNASKNSKHHKKKTDPVIIVVSMLYVIIYTVRYCLLVIILIINIYDGRIPSLIQDEIWEYTKDSCFVVGHILFYSLMILRLQKGFNGSVYETKKCLLVLLYTLLLLIFIINEIYFIVRHNHKNEKSIFYHDEQDGTYKIHTYLFSVLVLLNIFLGIMILYKFNNNIYKLVRWKSRTKRRESTDSENEIDEQMNTAQNTPRKESIRNQQKILDEKQLHFLGISIKYTLLYSICIIFTNIQFSGRILLEFDVLQCPEKEWFAVIWNWIFDIVLCVNFLCIWLSFPFSKSIYYNKCICGYWHKKCEKQCSYIVAAKIHGDIQEEVKQYSENKKEAELALQIKIQ